MEQNIANLITYNENEPIFQNNESITFIKFMCAAMEQDMKTHGVLKNESKCDHGAKCPHVEATLLFDILLAKTDKDPRVRENFAGCPYVHTEEEVFEISKRVINTMSGPIYTFKLCKLILKNLKSIHWRISSSGHIEIALIKGVSVFMFLKYNSVRNFVIFERDEMQKMQNALPQMQNALPQMQQHRRDRDEGSNSSF